MKHDENNVLADDKLTIARDFLKSLEHARFHRRN